MKLKKRKRSRRMRGSRLYGYAAKKHKGKGSRGGKGMSGTGKRADQKKTFVIKYMYPYFGKKGFTSKSTKRKKTNQINIEDIEKNLESFIKKGIAKETKEGIEINLPKHKILGSGEIRKKIIIKAKGFSKKAKEKIEKVGGKAIIVGKKVGKPAEKEQQEEMNKESAGKAGKEKLVGRKEKEEKNGS